MEGYIIVRKKSMKGNPAAALMNGHSSPYHPVLVAVKGHILSPPPAWETFNDGTADWWKRVLAHEREAVNAAAATGAPQDLATELMHEAAVCVWAAKAQLDAAK